MKRSKFSDSHIIYAVKQVESDMGVPDICRELGVISTTFYSWHAKYGGMDVSMMYRMKELVKENRLSRRCIKRKSSKPEPCTYLDTRKHEGQVAVKQSNTRWCSDGLELSCDNGERVRVAFALECWDREVDLPP